MLLPSRHSMLTTGRQNTTKGTAVLTSNVRTLQPYTQYVVLNVSYSEKKRGFVQLLAPVEPVQESCVFCISPGHQISETNPVPHRSVKAAH